MSSGLLLYIYWWILAYAGVLRSHVLRAIRNSHESLSHAVCHLLSELNLSYLILSDFLFSPLVAWGEPSYIFFFSLSHIRMTRGTSSFTQSLLHVLLPFLFLPIFQFILWKVGGEAFRPSILALTDNCKTIRNVCKIIWNLFYCNFSTLFGIHIENTYVLCCLLPFYLFLFPLISKMKNFSISI